MTKSNRDIARSQVKLLVDKYLRSRRVFEAADYSEAQARIDFITPLFAALGWDIRNDQGLPPDQREVSQEPYLDDMRAERSTRPDYVFRRGRARMFYVEAKKPFVSIVDNQKAAFQARSYGVSGGTVISVLTNFRQLRIYRTDLEPSYTDHPSVGEHSSFTCEQYVNDFDRLYDALSRDVVFSGAFDQLFGAPDPIGSGTPFDAFFLNQLREWRVLLAQDISSNFNVSDAELTERVQRFINRIVFLRISEDRELEHFAALKRVASTNRYDDWQRTLQEAGARYNSCIFNTAADLELSGSVSPAVLTRIVDELYLPRSPYTFAVVQPSVLGAIYEQFLGEEIHQLGRGAIEIVDKPEVLAGNGVAVTPEYIANRIVERVLAPLTQAKPPQALLGIRIADISCGSGTFLLAAYEFLLNSALLWYVHDGPEKHAGARIFQRSEGDWRLTLPVKHAILLNCIYGLDIDVQAVEATRFGLLLKLIEDETRDSIDAFRLSTGAGALPSLAKNIKCGNSLVDIDRLNESFPDLDAQAFDDIQPLSVWEEFATVASEGGFSAIVGNPPYVRIQRMRSYAPLEVDYYLRPESGYGAVAAGNFDKYAVFFARAIQLLRPGGRLGYITPHKFFKAKSGQGLRKLLTDEMQLEEIVDFGLNQVFEHRTTYTSIIIGSKPQND